MSLTKVNYAMIDGTYVVPGAAYDVLGNGITNDTNAVKAGLAYTTQNPNKLLDLRAEEYVKYTDSGSGTINTSGRLTQPGDIGGGVARTINTDFPSSFMGGDGNGEVALGMYRKYTYTPGDTKLQNGFLYCSNVIADTGATPTSAANLQVQTKLNITAGSNNFAWHNFQSYVECNALQSHEPTAGYFASDATAGATPWGLVVRSRSFNSNAPFHVYGMQLEVGSEIAPQVSGKALSIWNAGTVPLTYGSVAFGAAGLTYGHLVTNKSDRNENETPHAGDITYGYAVEGSNRLVANFSSVGTTPIAVGNTVTGGTSGATGVVTRIAITSGSWATNNAVGQVWIYSTGGTFVSGDALLVSGVSRAIIGASAFQPVGSITNGFEASNIGFQASPPTYSFLASDVDHNPRWFVSGNGAAGCTIVAVANNVTTFSAAHSNVFQLDSSTLGTGITDITNHVAGQVIYIAGGGGASPTIIKNNSGTGSTNINLASGDWTGTLRKTLQLIWTGQWQEVSRT